MSNPVATGGCSHDRTGGRSDRLGMFLGLTEHRSMDMALNRPGIYGDNPEAYGQGGWGGPFGCADPAAVTAIGQVRNRMGPERAGDPRSAGLRQAILRGAQPL